MVYYTYYVYNIIVLQLDIRVESICKNIAEENNVHSKKQHAVFLIGKY